MQCRRLPPSNIQHIFAVTLLRLTRHWILQNPMRNLSHNHIFLLDTFIFTMYFLLCYHWGTRRGKSLCLPFPNLHSTMLPGTLSMDEPTSWGAIYNNFHYLQDRIKWRNSGLPKTIHAGFQRHHNKYLHIYSLRSTTEIPISHSCVSSM